MQNATHRTRRQSVRCAIPAAMLAAMIVLSSAFAPARARELWEGKWLEARSPDFVVTSELGKRTTTQLVQELEDFRTLVGAVTNAGVLKERVPTRVYVFKGEVPEIGLSGTIVGYFHPGMRSNAAAVRRDNEMSLGTALQHEYTHFVVRNQGHQAYPKWYDEGFAEVLSTVDLRDGRFTFGNASPGRMADLAMPGAWLPYSRVLDDSQLIKMTELDNARFYAQSWALVHYLTFGKPGLDFSNALKEYLADREQGTAPVPAFEKAFHEDTATLGKTIRNYLDHARYGRGELNHPFDPGRITVRELPPDEVAAELAGLCMAIYRYKEAGKFADGALAANPENASALVVRADLLKFAGKFAEAEPLYQKAIALEPASDLHHLDFGEYWLTRARAAKDATVRHGFFTQARKEFFLANKINDSNPETLAINGDSYLREGADPAKGLPTLELAHALLPSSTEIKMMLAQMYVALGQGPKARPMLQSVMAWGKGKTAEAAGKLLATIDGTAAGVSGTPAAAASGAETNGTGETPPPSRHP